MARRSLKGKVVTLFGGAGFIGRHVVRRLAKAGATVRIAVRDPEAALFLKTAGEVGQIVPFPADITQPAQVAAALAGADAAVNMVGILYERGRATFQAVHVDGAATVARAAADAGLDALVHVSALGADPVSPSAYARSKAQGEDAVRTAFPGAVVLRPSVVFGPEDSFFTLFAALARFSPVLPVVGASPKRTGCAIDWLGDGGPKFQPVYVGDVADAVMAGLSDPALAGRTAELGGPTVYSFKALMELVNTATGRKRCLVPVPYLLAEAESLWLQFLPKPPLTPDQVTLLKSDNVVGQGATTLADLSIAATPAETVVPGYLSRFRPQAA